MNQYFILNFVVSGISLLATAFLATRLPSVWFWGATGFLGAVFTVICIGALVVGAYLLSFPNGDLWETAKNDMSGVAAFLLESGIEFGLLGQAVGPIGYLAARYRGRKTKNA